MLVSPSPKVHDQEVGLPVDWSRNVITVLPAGPWKSKAATGVASVTVTIELNVLSPNAFEAVSVTV